MSACKKCGGDDWYIYSSGKRQCNPCRRVAKRAYYQRNKEKILTSNKEWWQENPDKARKYSRSRITRDPDYYRRYHQEVAKPSGKHTAHAARRRATKLQATPSWFDNKEVNYIYALAKDKGLEVDHIVPLISDTVCGLHVQDNLRCVSKGLNNHKGNHYWSDMP